MPTDWSAFRVAVHAWLVRATGLRPGQIVHADQNVGGPKLEEESTFSQVEALLFGDLGTVIQDGTLIEVDGAGSPFRMVGSGQIDRAAEDWANGTFYSRADVVRGIDGSLFVCLKEGTSDREGSGPLEPTAPATEVEDTEVLWQYVGDGDAWGVVATEAVDAGPVSAAAGLLSVIPDSQAVPGWDGAWNSADASLGQHFEQSTDYLTFRFGNTRRAGGPPGTRIKWLGPTAPRGQEIELRAEVLAEVILSLQAITQAVEGNSNARAYLEAAQASLELSSFREQLNAAGLGILGVGDVLVLPAVFGASVEGRASLELRLAYLQTAAEKIGYIRTVKLVDGLLGDEEFTVPK